MNCSLVFYVTCIGCSVFNLFLVQTRWGLRMLDEWFPELEHSSEPAKKATLFSLAEVGALLWCAWETGGYWLMFNLINYCILKR